MGLIRLTALNWNDFKADIDRIEAEAIYPLGNDFFQIDHGASYFAFFERLGQLYYYGWQEEGKVVAVAAGVLRNLMLNGSGQERFSAWYLCDLKVHSAYQGRNIPFQLLAAALPAHFLQCGRGYAISMDAPGMTTNRIAHILNRFRSLRFSAIEKLLIWSLNQKEMDQALPLIQKHRGPVSFLTLQGIKDIISTGKPLPLLHAQFGPMGARGGLTTNSGAIHMFCSPATDPLTFEIQAELGWEHSASATIIAHRMKGNNWSWLLTSDI